MECSHCHRSDYIYSDRPQGFECILYILGFSRFFCRNCYQSYLKFRLFQNLQSLLSHWLHHEVITIRYVHSSLHPAPNDIQNDPMIDFDRQIVIYVGDNSDIFQQVTENPAPANETIIVDDQNQDHRLRVISCR